MSQRARVIAAMRAARTAGVPVSRAERFGRERTIVPLIDLARWPQWPAHDAAARERVWRIAALVAARDVLPEVIDGATLRAYAAAVGEEALEAVLDLPAGGAGPLPPATLLAESGRRIADRALPAPLARATGVEPIGDEAAARHIETAERIAA